MTYIQIPLRHLASLSDGELIHVTGIYTRALDHAVLTAGDRRLQLLGIPFTYIPRQQAKVEVWGKLVQGKIPRLYIHDARPVGADSPTPHSSEIGKLGDEICLTAYVRWIGHDQVATTPDQQMYVLLGEELDQRHYTMTGRVIGLHPPILEVVQALPLVQLPPATRDW